MTKKGKIKGLLVFAVFLLSTTWSVATLTNQNSIKAISYNDSYEIISQGFETQVPQTEWQFAHESYFSRSTEKVKVGTYSLKAAGTTGQTYDGVQHSDVFSDGWIEGWIYAAHSNYLTPSLWLRTSTMSIEENPSFDDGYRLRLYIDKVSIARCTDYKVSSLASKYIGYFSNKWLHVKFKATGTLLEAWVTTSDTFSETPTVSYDTINDQVKYKEGNAGISARTKMSSTYYATYFDAIKITYQCEEWKEGFETSPLNGWNFAHPNYFSRSTSRVKEGTYSLKAQGPGGVTYDGAQLSVSFTDGSIEGWVYPDSSNYLIAGLWLRTTSNNPNNNPTIQDGYLLRLYVNKAHIIRVSNGQITGLKSISIGYIMNKYWHLKFKATGTLLEGWVSQESTFTEEPQLTYNTENDDIKLAYGKAAISARTTMSSGYKLYFDGLRIAYCDGDKPPTYDGYVKDNYNHYLANAKVELIENSYEGTKTVKTVYTDENGYYKIQYLTDDYWTYKLRASKESCVTSTIEVPAAGVNEVITRTIVLTNEVKKYALIVGIEQYANDYVIENIYGNLDADGWYNRFANDYNYDYVIVLGDQSSFYQHKDDLATEANIKSYLNYIVSNADWNDIVAFIFSGTGYNDGTNSYLCAYYYDDSYYDALFDYELATILENCQSTSIFVFLDTMHCQGFQTQLSSMANSESLYYTAACTSGYKYWSYYFAQDLSSPCSIWSYWFLFIEPYDGEILHSVETIIYYALMEWNAYINAHYTNWKYVFPTEESFPPIENRPTTWDGSSNDFYLNAFN